ncbi:hypothetical protein BD310DRAFT_138896 [Dichomitus squalens]|uniref:Uncharacterized protein n=1 Tax=Dichomitus squalens TaxID=114155 RepID=A0A4V2K6V5_9APHY|nr:hypothetical protein BD310DRAFT_138896 [Dichomitus squalens]
MRSTITSESAVNRGANSGIGFLSFLQDPLRALTQVIFTLSDYMKFSFTTWRILIRRAQSPSNFRHLGGSTKSPIYLTRWKTARLPSPRTPRNRDIVSLEFKSRLLPCEAEPHGCSCSLRVCNGGDIDEGWCKGTCRGTDRGESETFEYASSV